VDRAVPSVDRSLTTAVPGDPSFPPVTAANTLAPVRRREFRVEVADDLFRAPVQGTPWFVGAQGWRVRVRVAGLHDNAFVHEHDAVTHLAGEAHLVSDHHHGHPCPALPRSPHPFTKIALARRFELISQG
jgi:hypothetical protein